LGRNGEQRNGAEVGDASVPNVGVEGSAVDESSFADDAPPDAAGSDVAVNDSAGGTDGGTLADATGGDAAGGGDVGADGTGNTDGGGGGDATSDAAMPPDSGHGGPDASVDATPPPDASGDGSRDASSDALPHPDSSSGDSGACDFAGTWGSRLTIDVSWAPQGLTSIILAPGTGQIKQWIKGVRVVSGKSLTDTTIVCGVALPDFQETAIAGSETYGVRFPNSLFDNGYLPSFTVNGTVSGFTAGSTYATTETAALLGLTLTNPTTAPWPSTVTTSVDSDKDGKPGVTIDVAQGSPYSDIPTEFPPFFQMPARAKELYVAIRQVTQVSGTVDDCDHASGTITIPQIQTSGSGGTSKYAIDSHVLGCMLESGADCSASQASFVDNTQPVFTPSGTTDFHSLRLAAGATCADVRSMLP
jgi:hypothetical protein